MARPMLLSAGVLLLIVQLLQPLSIEVQFGIFFLGILILGIPHGAADLLVAMQNAKDNRQTFSTPLFFLNYLGRLVLFGCIIWFFPLAGNLLFILFAAYHFGETDLHKFKTDSIPGKLFVISYGLLILAVILLHHFEQMTPLFSFFNSSKDYTGVTNFISEHRYGLLSCCGIFFFASTFLYFSTTPTNQYSSGLFLVQFAFILVILFNLPMVLGFSFYFIVWHSLLSLKNIVAYLRKDQALKTSLIVKQIVFYSSLAIGGMAVFGFTGFMFVNNNTLMINVFLGLAVLTAPHMQIMHSMYKSIRSQSPSFNTV